MIKAIIKLKSAKHRQKKTKKTKTKTSQKKNIFSIILTISNRIWKNFEIKISIKKIKKNKNVNDFIKRLYRWIFEKHVYYVKKSNCLKCDIKNYSIKKCINKKKFIKTKTKAFTNSKKLKN